MKYLILFIILFALFASCSKDLGNYSYTDVNRIAIDSVLEGGSALEKSYTVVYGDTLTIDPTVTGSLSGNDDSYLEFRWIIAGDTVSSNKMLQYKANEFGKLTSSFIVLDKSTGLYTIYNFFIDVVNAFSKGYFILTEQANNDAVLYGLSSIDVNKPVERLNAQGLDNFGKYPINLGGYRGYESGGVDYHYKIMVGVKEAQYNISWIDTREFLGTAFYNSSSTVDNSAFNPTSLLTSTVLGKVYALNNGKIQIANQGAIGLPRMIDDPLDYYIEPGHLVPPMALGGMLISFYDSKNNKVRFFSNGLFDFVNLDNYINSYDNVDPNRLISGHTYLYGAETGLGSYLYLTKKDKTLYSYSVPLNFLTLLPTNMVLVRSNNLNSIGQDVDNISHIQHNYTTNYWFISIGRIIYRCSNNGLDFVKYIELPADDTGAIAKFHVTAPIFDPNPNKLVIATYNSTSSETKKGSFYVYNISTATSPRLEITSKYSIDKCVDIFVGM